MDATAEPGNPEQLSGVAPINRCERCGFAFHGGFIWIVERRKVHLCRECHAAIEANSARLTSGSTQTKAQIDALARRLGARGRGRQVPESHRLLAGLLSDLAG